MNKETNVFACRQHISESITIGLLGSKNNDNRMSFTALLSSQGDHSAVLVKIPTVS